MPLIPLDKKPMSIYTNRREKKDSTYREPKHDSYGSKDTITDELNRSGSDPMTMEYTAKYAPVVIPQYPKHNNSVSNTTMTYEHERFMSNTVITEYTTKDSPIVITLNVNANSSRSQGNQVLPIQKTMTRLRQVMRQKYYARNIHCY